MCAWRMCRENTGSVTPKAAAGLLQMITRFTSLRIRTMTSIVSRACFSKWVTVPVIVAAASFASAEGPDVASADVAHFEWVTVPGGEYAVGLREGEELVPQIDYLQREMIRIRPFRLM